ncbi:helix-turn-helix domain-containing protein [Clostridium perfringens]|uniref:helix-turn-helix domain-containing protein n=1 Tax=Clostridium perfringens TaxID=1502 RepID=UPI0039EBE121
MLKEIRRKRNISQKCLAQKLGISQSYLSELESKKSIPSISTIKKLSNVLELCPIRIINFYEEDELEFNCCIKCYEKECK